MAYVWLVCGFCVAFVWLVCGLCVARAAGFSRKSSKKTTESFGNRRKFAKSDENLRNRRKSRKIAGNLRKSAKSDEIGRNPTKSDEIRRNLANIGRNLRKSTKTDERTNFEQKRLRSLFVGSSETAPSCQNLEPEKKQPTPKTGRLCKFTHGICLGSTAL